MMTNSTEEMQNLVTEFETECKRRKLRVIVSKSKAIRFLQGRGTVRWDVSEGKCFRYMGVGITANEPMKRKWIIGLVKGRRFW